MRNIAVIAGLQNSVPPIADLTDQLPRHATKTYPMRRAEDIDTLIFHHMASEAPLVNQASYHVNGRGWAGIGYHLVIDTDRIVQTNDLLAQTNHTSGWNHRAIGIAVRGDLSRRAMTDLERLLVNAAGVTVKFLVPTIKHIYGHNEASKLVNKPGTLCPATDMVRIRKDIKSLEETMSYAIENNVQERIMRMFRRMVDLQGKYNDEKNPYHGEAVRKLLLVDQALRDNEFYR